MSEFLENINYLVDCNLVSLYGLKSPLNVSKLVNSLQINKNYIEHTRPIYRIDLAVNDSLADLINNSPDLKLLLTVKPNTGLPETDLSDLNHIDGVLLKPITFTKYQAQDTLLGTTVEKLMENRNNVPFFIEAFENEHMRMNEKTLNICMRDVNVETVINVLYSQTGLKHDYFNFIKPDNQKVYPEIFIPPMNFSRALVYLDNNFGIYKSKPMIFQDGKSLNIRPMDKVYNTVSNRFVNPINLEVIHPVKTKEGELHQKAVENSIPYREDLIVNNFTNEKIRELGNKLILVDETSASDNGNLFYTEEILLDELLKDYITNHIGEKTNFITNNHRNKKFFKENLLSEIKRSLVTTTLVFNNPKELIFNPELFFNVLFNKEDYEIYNGLWGISECVTVYQKLETEFNCMVYTNVYKIID